MNDHTTLPTIDPHKTPTTLYSIPPNTIAKMSDDGERETKPFKFVTGKLQAPLSPAENGLIANFCPAGTYTPSKLDWTQLTVKL